MKISKIAIFGPIWVNLCGLFQENHLFAHFQKVYLIFFGMGHSHSSGFPGISRISWPKLDQKVAILKISKIAPFWSNLTLQYKISFFFFLKILHQKYFLIAKNFIYLMPNYINFLKTFLLHLIGNCWKLVPLRSGT